MDFFFITDRENASSTAGPNPFVLNVAQSLRRRGYHPVVAIPGPASDNQELRSIDGVTIATLGTPRTFGTAVRQYWRDHNNRGQLIESVTRHPWFIATPKDAVPTAVIIHHLSNGRYSAPASKQMDWKKIAAHYRKLPTVTTLPSTHDHLRRMGFKRTYVIPPAASLTTTTPAPRSPYPLWLAPLPVRDYEVPDDIDTAFFNYHRLFPEAQLIRVADTDGQQQRQTLTERAIRNGYVDNVRWIQPNDLGDHPELLGRAWGVLMTAPPDDGIDVLLSAFRQATPAIVYDLPGLGDAVESGKTGLTIRPQPQELTKALGRLTELNAVRTLLGLQAKHYARHFLWDRTADRLLGAIGVSG